MQQSVQRLAEEADEGADCQLLGFKSESFYELGGSAFLDVVFARLHLLVDSQDA